MFKFRKKKPTFPSTFPADQLEKLNTLPYGVKGNIDLLGHPFNFHDARCFYDSYQEIIVGKIYEFKPTTRGPVIIDCGANMGLSVLFFSTNYPGAKITAFEPEKEIFDVLEKNVTTFHLDNVTLINKAVWDKETTLEFYSDHGMGGSVENVFKKKTPESIHTVRLADYLNQKVDFLKMDIEGAEYTVLKDCKDLLKNVEHLFVEYHSYVKKEQHLDDILSILKNAGFRYHLRQSFSRNSPFIDKTIACENMDMAINIFAYRKEA